MYVKTQFNTIVNLAKFEKIKIRWSVKARDSNKVYHMIYAVSEETSKSETLAQFRQNMEEQAKNAYEYLFTALFQGKTAFDMTHYTSQQ